MFVLVAPIIGQLVPGVIVVSLDHNVLNLNPVKFSVVVMVQMFHSLIVHQYQVDNQRLRDHVVYQVDHSIGQRIHGPPIVPYQLDSPVAWDNKLVSLIVSVVRLLSPIYIALLHQAVFQIKLAIVPCHVIKF
jgi:hypothetical protein